MTPIPVLGCLVYNRGDLLTRMIESIDYPVSQIVHVANGVDESVVTAHKRIRDLYPNNHTIFVPGDGQPREVNLGYAGGNNWILKNFMNDWVLLVGSDIQFRPGQLQKIAEYYERHKKDSPSMPVVNTNYGWNCTGITKAGIDTIGYLDENFYPLYYEDCDFNWRHTIARKQGLVSYPAEGECQVNLHHDTSSTTHNLPEDKRNRMHAAFSRNVDYYIQKWGGAQCHELWEHPFNDPSKSIRDWTLDPTRWEMNRLQ
jgi:GT2 family glycosyltransferase